MQKDYISIRLKIETMKLEKTQSKRHKFGKQSDTKKSADSRLSADFSCLPWALHTDAGPKGRGLCALEQGDVMRRAGLNHLLGPYAGLYFADVRSAE